MKRTPGKALRYAFSKARHQALDLDTLAGGQQPGPDSGVRGHDHAHGDGFTVTPPDKDRIPDLNRVCFPGKALVDREPYISCPLGSLANRQFFARQRTKLISEDGGQGTQFCLGHDNTLAKR